MDDFILIQVVLGQPKYCSSQINVKRLQHNSNSS